MKREERRRKHWKKNENHHHFPCCWSFCFFLPQWKGLARSLKHVLASGGSRDDSLGLEVGSDSFPLKSSTNPRKASTAQCGTFAYFVNWKALSRGIRRDDGRQTVRAWKVAERARTSAQAQSSMLTIVSLQCRSTATQSLPKLLCHPARVIIIFIIVNVIFILLLSTSLSSLLVLANKTFFYFTAALLSDSQSLPRRRNYKASRPRVGIYIWR